MCLSPLWILLWSLKSNFTFSYKWLKTSSSCFVSDWAPISTTGTDTFFWSCCSFRGVKGEPDTQVHPEPPPSSRALINTFQVTLLVSWWWVLTYLFPLCGSWKQLWDCAKRKKWHSGKHVPCCVQQPRCPCRSWGLHIRPCGPSTGLSDRAWLAGIHGQKLGGRWKNRISLFQQQQTIMWLKPHQEITLEFLFLGVI